MTYHHQTRDSEDTIVWRVALTTVAEFHAAVGSRANTKFIYRSARFPAVPGPCNLVTVDGIQFATVHIDSISTAFW